MALFAICVGKFRPTVSTACTASAKVPTMRDRLRAEVLVVGAGPAGLAAALSAARAGADTLLVERFGSAGGCLTQGLALTPIGFEPFRDWARPTDPATWKVQGIARELHDRMAAEGAICKPLWDVET